MVSVRSQTSECMVITFSAHCASLKEGLTFLYSYRKDLHSALPNLEIIDGVCRMYVE